MSRGWSGRRVAVVGVLGAVVAMVLLSALANLARSVAGGGGGGQRGGPASIAVIRVNGVIAEDPSTPGLLGGGGGTSARVFRALATAAGTDPSIRAVVVRVNSPGGGVVASSEIYRAIRQLDASKPVVVSMGDEAASGGYYISMGARRVFANPDTTTGSIGVILHLQYLQGLYDKVGIKEEVIKSGPHKDIGSRPLTPEEHQILQNLIDDAYQRFVGVVADGRHLSREAVSKVADGSVFSGSRALGLGLVDQLGDLQDAELAAAQLAGLGGVPPVVELQQQTSLLGAIQGRLVPGPTQVQLTLPQLDALGPGYAMEYLALPPGE